MGTVNYIWDPLVDSYLMETDGSNNTQAVYTTEPEHYGRVVSQRRGSTSSYYHYDGSGSTRALTINSETVTDTNMYDAWGVTRVSTGSTVNSFEYVGDRGYYLDDDTNNYYVRERVYRPQLGRWLSDDPSHPHGSYEYVNSSPPNKSDPSGLQGLIIVGVPPGLILGGQPLPIPIVRPLPRVSPYPRLSPGTNADAVLRPPSSLRPNLPIPPITNDPLPPSSESPPGRPATKDFPLDKPQTEPWNFPKNNSRPANDCPDAQYLRLRNRVFIYCKNPGTGPGCSHLGKISVKFKLCSTLRSRIRNWKRCCDARKEVIFKCYRGGDQIHREKVAKCEFQISSCYYWLRWKRCHPYNTIPAYPSFDLG